MNEVLKITNNELYDIVRKYKKYPYNVYGFTSDGEVILAPEEDDVPFRTVSLKQLLLELLECYDQLVASEVGNYFTKKEVALLSRIVDGFLVMNDSYSERQEAIIIKGKLQRLQSGEQDKDSPQQGNGI